MSRVSRDMHGVTLIELMVVVVIIGILATIAIPGYEAYVRRSHRGDGKECLLRVHQRMETYRTRKQTYTTSLSALGYSGLSSGALVCSTDDLYRVTIAAATPTCPIKNCYQLLATARGRQSDDGNLRLTYNAAASTANQRRILERDDGGTWVAWD